MESGLDAAVFLRHLPTRVHMSPPQALCAGENKRAAVWCGSEWWFLVCMKHAAILDTWWQTGLWLHLTLFSLTASSPWLYIPNCSGKQGGSRPLRFAAQSVFPMLKVKKLAYELGVLLYYCSLACWCVNLRLFGRLSWSLSKWFSEFFSAWFRPSYLVLLGI